MISYILTVVNTWWHSKTKAGIATEGIPVRACNTRKSLCYTNYVQHMRENTDLRKDIKTLRPEHENAHGKLSMTRLTVVTLASSALSSTRRREDVMTNSKLQ